MSKSYLCHPNLIRLRALKMLEHKLTGKTNKEIGEIFGVSAATVNRALTLADRGDLTAQFEDQILKDLVPLAVSAFKTALTNGDAQVALEVLKGTNLLKKQGDKRPVGGPDNGDGDELEIYIRKKRGEPARGITNLARPVDPPHRSDPPDDPRGLPPGPPGAVAILEGEIL